MSKTIEKILLNFETKRVNLLPALKKISADFGYVGKNEAKVVADYFGVSLAEIYEVVSFYDDLKEEKEYAAISISICSGPNCVLNKSERIRKIVEDYFGIKSGDEFNPKVNLKMISCQGRCHDGPVVAINKKIYERVSEGRIAEILKGYV